MEYTQEHVDRGSDRLGLHVYPEPDSGPTDAPAVAVWPAMGVPAGYYRRFALELRAAGLAVVVADLRGTGASTPRASRASRYGYPDLVADVAAVQQALQPRLNGRRPLLLGHSLGGQCCALHLARAADAGTDPGVAGLVLVAVGLPYWRSYPGVRRYGVLPFAQGLDVVARGLGVWPGWGFGGRQARGVIRDWAYTARHGRFPDLDGVDVETALGTVDTRVLAVSVDDDQYTPASTLEHLCAKLTAAEVRRHHYTVAEAGAPLDHFTWVRAAGPLARRIAAFARELPNAATF